VKDDGVLSELVEVGYRFYENRRGGGDAGELACADGLKDREERIRILANSDELVQLSELPLKRKKSVATYLCLSLCNNASCVVLLQ
jgi:hypothetical protein